MYQACESLRGMVNSLNPATYTPWGCSLKSKLLEFINAVASFDKRLVGFALTLKVHPLIEKLLGPAELTQLFTNCSSLHSKMGKQTLHEFNFKIREERTKQSGKTYPKRTREIDRCHFCKRGGHQEKDCRLKKRRTEESERMEKPFAPSNMRRAE